MKWCPVPCPPGGSGGLAPSGISVNYPCLASAAAVPCPRALPPIFFRPKFFRRNFFVRIFFENIFFSSEIFFVGYGSSGGGTEVRGGTGSSGLQNSRGIHSICHVAACVGRSDSFVSAVCLQDLFLASASYTVPQMASRSYGRALKF